MTRALLLLIIFIAIAANAASENSAKNQVLNFDEDVENGMRVEFSADAGSGFYEVLDQGHVLNRDDLHCRNILSVGAGQSSTHIFCYRNRERDVVNIDPKNYVVDIPSATPSATALGPTISVTR